MNIPTTRKKEYHFPGITVLVPPQLSGVDIIPIVKDIIPNISQLEHIDVNVIRVIANIAFIQITADKIRTPATTFEPPVEFRVGYNIQDVMAAGCNFDILCLAYWNGISWIYLNAPQHEYHILPPTTGQVAEFWTDFWPEDPPLAWVT